MNRQFARDALGWGFALWLIGYVLGVVLIGVAGPSLVGWVILPIGACLTVWVLTRKVSSGAVSRYVGVAVSWTAIAIVFDYLLIVKLFHPADGYYKADVYLYYALTLALPIVIGWWKSGTSHSAKSEASMKPHSGSF